MLMSLPRAGLIAAAALLCAAPAMAAEGKIDPADTGFMIVATALVLLMTLPGLALFYCGMVGARTFWRPWRRASPPQRWCRYSGSPSAIASPSGRRRRVRRLRSFLPLRSASKSVSPFAGTIPEMLFVAYQMTFAVITCALVGGAVADRLKFSAFALFCPLWLLLVYVPSAHWVWGGGFLARLGLIDFAGGTVVHINAGVAGLVAALVVGARQGYGREISRRSICRRQ